MSLSDYHSALKTVLTGIYSLPVLDGTIDEILDQEGESEPQFIALAPATTDVRLLSDSQNLQILEQYFNVGVYVTLGRDIDDSDVAFTLAMDAYWAVHQALRNQTVEGFQIFIDDGAGRIEDSGSNHERYELQVIINIAEDTAPCSQ